MENMTRKIRVGFIGTGGRGTYLLDAIASHPAVEITALCDPKEENLNRAAQTAREKLGFENVALYTFIEEMLASDVEAVVVATHIAKHAEVAAQALDAGKHVLSEIPTVGSVEDARLLLRKTAEHPELKYMAGENCCFWPFIRKWKEMYDAGELGDVLMAEGDYLHMASNVEPLSRRTWRSDLHAITYITHELGPLLYILGDEPDVINGYKPTINPYEDQHPGPPNGTAIIRTKKGSMIKIFIGFGVVHEPGHNYILYGTKGTVENGRAGIGDRYHSYVHSLDYKEGHGGHTDIPSSTYGAGADDAGHGGADPMMCRHFIDSILNDTQPELDVEFGIRISLPGVLADISSYEDSRPVKMPSMDELRS